MGQDRARNDLRTGGERIEEAMRRAEELCRNCEGVPKGVSQGTTEKGGWAGAGHVGHDRGQDDGGPHGKVP